ncbi:MAG TPA: hypothetical protein VIF57_30630 [Polyangia bacterium]|jgi:4-amino-4-deoxy-L-arabinose transferase-like glycosyltransferase
MSRRRHIASLVAGAFSAALTVLPWLHTWHHRDDHVHVDGAIVFLDHGHHGDGHDAEHGDEHDDDDVDADAESPGFDHPEHHGPHARGALAHGAAFILAGAIFLLPPPAAALEQAAPPPCPGRPAPTERRSPRVTRGPPLTT